MSRSLFPLRSGHFPKPTGCAPWMPGFCLVCLLINPSSADERVPVRTLASVQNLVPVLKLVNGDYLPGRLADSDQADHLVWSSPAFAGEYQFLASAVSGIHFAPPDKSLLPNGDYLLELAGGDLLFGSLISADQDVLVFHDSTLDRITVRRSHIRRLSRWNHGEDQVYLGPDGLNGWTVRAPADKPDAWRDDAGQVHTDVAGAAIYRDLGIPPQARIEFELSWTSSADFDLAFGVDADPATALRAFRLEVWDGNIVAFRETERAGDVALVESISAAAGRLRLVVYLDQTAGRMIVVAPDGQEIADLTVESAKPETQAGLSLTNHAGDIRLETIRVGRWNGAPPRSVEMARTRIHLTDNQVVYGEPTAYDPVRKKFAIETAEGLRQFPEDRVQDIHFVRPQQQPDLPAFRAVLRSGLRLSGSLLGVKQGRLALQSPALGEPVSLPLDTLHLLLGLRAQAESPVLPGRSGRLELAESVLHGCLVDTQEQFPGRLVWRSPFARDACALAADVSGRVVYGEIRLPKSARPQAASTPQAPQARQGFLGNLIGGLMPNRPADPTANRRRRTREKKPSSAGSILHLRSGDMIPCQIIGLDEQGVSFQSDATDVKFVRHDQLQALELNPDVPSVGILKLKKDRLLMLPRMQRDNPPTQLIRAVDGDYLRGRVVGMDDQQLHVEIRLAVQSLPRERIARLIWLRPKTGGASSDSATASPAFEGARIQAVSRSGNRQTFVLERQTGAELAGRSEHLGHCRVNLEETEQLLLGGAIEQSASTLAFHQWKLRPPIEPRALDENSDDGEGTESSLVGKPAPEIELELLGGGTFRLADRLGKIVVLDFWASWCPPCLQTMPQVDRVVEEFAERGVELVGVNLEESADRIQAALDRLQLDFPVALDASGRVAERYGATAIPQTVIIDREGRVARLYVGGGPRFGEVLRAALEEILNRNPAESPAPNSETTRK